MPRGGIFGESRRGARDVLKVLKSRDRGHLGPRALIMTHSPMPSTNSCTVAMQQLPRSARGSGTRWLVHKLTQGWKKAFQLAGQLASSLGNLSVQLSDQVSETRAGGRGTVLYRVAYRYPSASAHSVGTLLTRGVDLLWIHPSEPPIRHRRLAVSPFALPLPRAALRFGCLRRAASQSEPVLLAAWPTSSS